MAQSVDIIDLRRSFIPVDPDAFPITLHDTEAEDAPEKRIPVIPYSGYNFIPTSQGYASFYGINNSLDIASVFGADAIEATEGTDAVYGYTYPAGATVDALKTYWNTNINPGFSTFAPWSAFLTVNGATTDEELLEMYNTANPGATEADVRGMIWALIAIYCTGGASARNTFFGGDRVLDLDNPVIPAVPPTEAVDAIPGTLSGVDDIFMIQTDQYENILVALCGDGIWIKRTADQGGWDHILTLLIPPEGTVKKWSKCVIDNAVYVYRQGEAGVARASPTDNYSLQILIPTGINMEGQLGIFKAGGRLGFWDSENSIGWSSLVDTTAFGNSEELSGFTIFQDIVGRIVNILPHGDGFIIYCTRSIVHVRRNVNSQMLWQGRAIFNSNGISYRSEVCTADPDTTHFAYTTHGLVEITNGEAQFIEPEIYNYIKQKRQPVMMKMLNGRYLHFQMLDIGFNVGITKFRAEFTKPLIWQREVRRSWEDYQATQTFQAMKTTDNENDLLYYMLWGGYTGGTLNRKSVSVPIWQDRLATSIAPGVLFAWAESGTSGIGSTTWFDPLFTENHSNTSVPVAEGYAIDYIDTPGTSFFSVIPFNGDDSLNLAFRGSWLNEELGSLISERIIEPNTRNFFAKQEMIWMLEDMYWRDYKYAVEHHDFPRSQVAASLGIGPDGAFELGLVDVQNIMHTVGPFVDLERISEANVYFGYSHNSAWAQRSFTRLAYFDINEQRRIVNTRVMQPWIAVPTFTEFATLAAARAGADAVFDAWYGESTPRVSEDEAGVYAFKLYNPGAPLQEIRFSTGGGSLPRTGDMADVYAYTATTTQTFGYRAWRYEPVETCKYRELGHTKIIGHGTYDINGNFTQTDSTAAAADYDDICLPTKPRKKYGPYFNGYKLPGNYPYNDGIVTIDGHYFNFEDVQTFRFTIPSMRIVLQDGANEPIYPTFFGAYVFDIQYKKWGKMLQEFLHLLDLFPINTMAGDKPIPYENFFPKAAALLPDGLIYPFDEFPDDSEIVFGKYGKHRRGFTDLHHIEIQHRQPRTGLIQVLGSLDNINVEMGQSAVEQYENDNKVVLNCSLSARWFDIVVQGHYDLVHLQATALRSSNR